MAQVTLDQIVKIYPGNVKAVDTIDLNVRDEEFIVLVGPSGCGKSTTLRMIAGLEDITEGTLKIGDKKVNDMAPKDRDIAMVFQNYALYPHMTVFKNMAFGLKLRKFDKKEISDKVGHSARMLGIEELLDRRPKALSGGQRQRVALGRAIVRDPAAFLFDEPLSNLDAKLRIETRAELKRLHKRLQTTTIYVTHDQEEAMTLGDRVVVMSDGRIQQCDTPLTVYNDPINRFVAGFLGMPPMNFLEGRLTADDGKTCFEGEGVKVQLTPEQAQKVPDQVNQEVVFGVRPEAFHVQAGQYASDETQTLTGEVDVTEPLGDNMDMYVFTSTKTRLVARVKAKTVEPGSKAHLYMDMTKTHLFEPGAYGRNLTKGVAG